MVSSIRRYRPSSRGGHLRSGLLAAALLAALALGATASAASAGGVNIVSQGAPPVGKLPKNTHYYKTIQEAVDASTKGTWVLIEPGTYDEEVLISSAHAGIHIRGMNRNTVIVDGQHKAGPEGANGIEAFKANNVSIENLTVRNFDRASTNGENGNEVWWNGGDETGVIGARKWFGDYLTTYDDGLLGGYGLFASNSVKGSLENSYASGFNDSGLYIGACRDCQARVFNVVMENNALGYSGSNSGGRLLFENSVFKNNAIGFVPNSENPSDPPPPQDGACSSRRNRSATPTFSSTEIERCTIFRNNSFEENNNINAPGNGATEAGGWGIGVELPGTYADLLENNTVTNNVNVGVLGFEYPNPFPIQEDTIFFAFSGNRISDNTFSGNGSIERGFSGDLTLQGGLFTSSVNNCVSGNSFKAAVWPEKIEETWGCQNKTTPNPENGEAAIGYILELAAESEARTPTPQPAPPAQPTMPNPCKGVPYNPLCQ
jgi:Protein of unknown function (DUF1565)